MRIPQVRLLKRLAEMDMERMKKKKYKMRVNESQPWLGSLNKSERDIKNLHERERESVCVWECCVGFILIFWVFVLCLFSCLISCLCLI